MKKGKILQVSAVATTMDKQLRPLIEQSIAEGYEVHLACANDGYMDALIKDGFVVHEIPLSRSINVKTNLKTIKELRRIMKEHSYDIVHLHTPVASILGRIAAKTSKVNHIIYTAHGYYFHEGMSKLQYRFYYSIEKFFAKFATDYLLLQSKEDYELSVKRKFKDENRIIHLGNGVEVNDKFNPSLYKDDELLNLKSHFLINEEDIVFSFIGRFVREKGIYDLVDAFQKLVKSGVQAKLLLIGDLNDSERDQEILQKVKEWREDPNIILTGVRSDIPQLLSISDVFILPSYREGLPRSIVEAMAMSKPVIATNIRGCREQVINNETGFLIEKNDVHELYEKMLFFSRNKQTCIEFGNRSREIAETHYDENKVLEKQIDLFNDLINNK